MTVEEISSGWLLTRDGKSTPHRLLAEVLRKIEPGTVVEVTTHTQQGEAIVNLIFERAT